MSELRNKIVLSEGTDDEKTIYLKRPKGRKAREMMPKVLAFMVELQKGQDSNGQSDVEQVLELIKRFWSKEEFEEIILPFVLQMDDADGRKYLNDNMTQVEVMDAFSSAAQYLIEESFQRKEVEEAMGKSKEEALEAPTTRKSRS